MKSYTFTGILKVIAPIFELDFHYENKNIYNDLIYMVNLKEKWNLLCLTLK